MISREMFPLKDIGEFSPGGLTVSRYEGQGVVIQNVALVRLLRFVEPDTFETLWIPAHGLRGIPPGERHELIGGHVYQLRERESGIFVTCLRTPDRPDTNKMQVKAPRSTTVLRAELVR